MIKLATTRSKLHQQDGEETFISLWQKIKSRPKALFNLLKETWKIDIIGGLSKELQEAMNFRLYFGMLLMMLLSI